VYNHNDGGFDLMEITWYGHSCFRLTERGLATVVTDPYDHEAIGYASLKLKADIVTVSHDAPGHNYLQGVKGAEHKITGPGEYEIGGVFITAVQTNGHTKRQVDELSNTLYVFDYSGVTVAHLGNMNRVPSQAEVEALGTVNVALVGVGGGSGLSAAKAVEVISLIEPNMVIPMHYAQPGVKVKMEPLEKFLKEMGVTNPERLSSLEVSGEKLPEETHVVILDCQQE
jgi:L-ascorbate metabolism protein UlaG (beta-lactamase superfamily)